ncbi:pentatricopeptide repeat-containing protein At4g13650-like isoform X2 [Nymphaea colorata]|nr:pentatricopeptide repeat-containing protein At4g13650-like isoform X2 [Nymphaea colorata]
MLSIDKVSKSAIRADKFYEEEMVGGDFEMGRSDKEIRIDGFDFLYLMEGRGIQPDAETFALLLNQAWRFKSVLDAKRIHGRILKLGFEGELSLGNKLINVYRDLGSLADAHQVFGTMRWRDGVSFSHIIAACIAEGRKVSALKYFMSMQDEGLETDLVTLSHVLKACFGGSVGFSFVRQLHGKIIRLGFHIDLAVGNPLIDLYAKASDIIKARMVFDELGWRDSTSWVAMISGYAQNGCSEEALFLFSQMQGSGIAPTPYIFSTVLSACAKIELLEEGKQLQAQVYKLGFGSETFVGNALITLYYRCGSPFLAEQIFDKMKHRDSITWNSMISGHAFCGNSERALEFFMQMQVYGLKPDPVTVASLLSACASIGDFWKGQELHAYVTKSGIESDYIVEGSLLDFYIKSGDLAAARACFDATKKTNVVLWNLMLVAYGQIGNLSDSLELFSQMQITGIDPNEYTYPSVLRTCTFLGNLDLGEQIHAQTVKSGFQLDVYVSSVLIDMYAKCGRLDIAQKMLDRLPEHDIVSWTSMISGYSQHDRFAEALNLFERMQLQGMRADNIGLSSAISACAGLQALEEGKKVHSQSVVHGYSSDLSIGNALVTLYARCGQIKEAYAAFQSVGDGDPITWNGLISGFAQSGHSEEAVQVFSRMHKAGIEASLYTFCSTISASANLADVKQGKQIHTLVIKGGHESDTEAGNVLVTLYAKCGSIEDAYREFLLIPQKNEVSWNAIITGYAQHGHGREALRLFEWMKEEGVRPNHITFIGVLSACSHVGLVSEGLGFFRSMSHEYSISPRSEHYACVVDILGRAGCFDDAQQFIEEMPIRPDAMVWRTLLSACTVRKNLELGQVAAQHLLELEPQDSATYVLLSNIYAALRKWDARDQIRQMMKDRRVKKGPGQSWIEVKNIVHAFFVGDRLHPLCEKIYEFLEVLTNRTLAIGYVPDHQSLLHDLELQQKDPTVYVHSEKLAISFGLMSSPPGIPLRIIKNLRVCNDCHTFMKYVSKVVSRAIIVRDANRFHHFDNGTCSCGDYW